mmetsp:Transcript_11262/g.26093  ORF Transcript_11262/g.26093 Transcript_11262/m.26093 type:complete len:360 (-) Transcript_11262:133-1212(-)|eukprot:CAMPEP_0116833112 /NCGR_PEP_ID=MMETSP0418-20121206/6257_1 /TAXON_ID=1158023 /ORGANISM="Astrosyne radiata, Strain 13vi08-1A" /LENGTH=359 /DNA_ID=CAMNT_0004462529 /DNA_START=35 /DNA_END=1114 /DNA_ORIENTATION=-
MDATAVEDRKEVDEVAVVAVEAPAETTQASSGSLPNSLVSEQEDDPDDEQEEEEEESEYEYEDEDETAFGGFLTDQQVSTSSVSDPSLALSNSSATAPAHIRDEEDSLSYLQQQQQQNKTQRQQQPLAKASTWREPSKEAVSMSLRAERETTGGKRRLASDLYKIMMTDTKEAGFSLEPKSEDSMDKWTIKLFQFDEDSNLSKDMEVLGLDHIELEMSFPDQYPFEPPFVRVVRPKFKRQTGFVMNGALCMELLTKDGWNPVNDIESVIVSIRSLLVVGDGRLAAAADMSEKKREELLVASRKRGRDMDNEGGDFERKKLSKVSAGHYSLAEAQAAYSHLSDYHKKKGWDTSGWWARKG